MESKSSYEQTTGKDYKDKARKCLSCGKVSIIKRDSVICPTCGSKDTQPYQRTTAKLPTA